MALPRYHNSPRPRRPKRLYLSRTEKVLPYLKLGVVLLLSPILMPILILLLPYILWDAHRERKAERARKALETLKPKPPPRSPDPELERRRELARRTNKQKHPRIRLLYDPISDDPTFAWVIKEAGQRAEEEVGRPYQMGFCHLIWRRKKQILKEEFGIDWYSPREMNPRVIFD
jgi:hypothetical protein